MSVVRWTGNCLLSHVSCVVCPVLEVYVYMWEFLLSCVEGYCMRHALVYLYVSDSGCSFFPFLLHSLREISYPVRVLLSFDAAARMFVCLSSFGTWGPPRQLLHVQRRLISLCSMFVYRLGLPRDSASP